ncbi:hypothetical protein [Campylobacter concisus]|uniref:Uncharacterized protein n=1 Tax=Campylobacter concisus TaxID=199 RepID=A0A1Y5NDQ8_9BACT|nr:hypothetical protein [Campylobacter concisus]OUT18937.1 hypothetical protein B9N61_01850 [Campylobacter concisus]QPH87774.1 hypothetical protein CVT15_03200 [Campylobacter concisus]QPI02716.1 hypothetical protein G5B95_03155 [Campylobacter concisus]
MKYLLFAAILVAIYIIFFKNRKNSDKVSSSNFEECSKCGVFTDIDQMVLRDGKYICKECIKSER